MDNRCRAGFREALRNVVYCAGRPKIVACGPRGKAFDRFQTHLKSGSADIAILLVDAETVVQSDANAIDPWLHVRESSGDKWDRPAGASGEHLHFMAVCMETWLVAAPETLAAFFGQGFKTQKLPQTTELERVEKPRLFQALADATRETTSGAYAKGRVSFALLERIDLVKVADRLPFCKRFIAALSTPE